MMQRDTLSKEAFINYSNENLIFMKVDFPTPDFESPEVSPSSRMLQQRLQVNVVPTYVLVSPDGKVLARQEGGLPGGPDAFIAWIKKSL
jgi:thioredoxin-related protein